MKAKLMISGLDGNHGRTYRVELASNRGVIYFSSMPGDRQLYCGGDTDGRPAAIALREYARAAIHGYVGTLHKPDDTLIAEVDLGASA